MTDHPAIAPQPNSSMRGIGPRVVIIGGGTSGVLMAVHLLKRQDRLFRITLLEERHAPGQGLAIATLDPDHLLNETPNSPTPASAGKRLPNSPRPSFRNGACRCAIRKVLRQPPLPNAPKRANSNPEFRSRWIKVGGKGR